MASDPTAGSPAGSGWRGAGGGRPAVSVVVPFSGDGAAAVAALERIGRIRTRPGDEVIVADNSPGAVVPREAAGAAGVRVVTADRERTSYHARNAGAEAARNPWLLFMDADCRPAPGLIDDYFGAPVPARCGIVAGAIRAGQGQTSTISRYARDRGHVSERFHIETTERRPRPAGVTGNVLVRREVWESLGGFHEGVRSGADVEFSWRAQDAGWEVLHRPAAAVEHVHVETLAAMMRQASRHAAGRLWVTRRYAGSFPRPRLLRPLARCAAGVTGWTLTGRFRRALYKAIDAAWFCADFHGWHFGSNAVAPEAAVRERGEPSLLVVTDAFPARSETFVYNDVLTIRGDGWRVRVESSSRPLRVERDVARRLPVSYIEDDSPRTKLRALGWLLLRHPLRCARDLVERRRWRRQEPVWGLAALAPAARRLATSREGHIHAHFAAGAALHAVRLSRLIGVPYSVTAHAYEIFQRPANLAEKLSAAVVVAAECEYTAAHLRGLVPEAGRSRVHRVATGVDARRFRRTRPHPGSGRVLAIGRLVEKKGFVHLIEAAELLRDEPVLGGVVLAGEGPLRPLLEEEIESRRLGGLVGLQGNVWGPRGVRGVLEDADVLAIPSVIARDGDRDALPLVCYEALAMEVPVVASDLVGLPEVVRPEWGRLVPPGDPEALAEALAELLRLSPERRRKMGVAGRRFVAERFDSRSEAVRLAGLIAAASARARES